MFNVIGACNGTSLNHYCSYFFIKGYGVRGGRETEFHLRQLFGKILPIVSLSITIGHRSYSNREQNEKLRNFSTEARI